MIRVVLEADQGESPPHGRGQVLPVYHECSSRVRHFGEKEGRNACLSRCHRAEFFLD